MMKRRSLLLIAALFFAGVAGGAGAAGAPDVREIKPKKATLFSRQTYKGKYEGYGRAAFSFEHGVRSDVGVQAPRNDYDLEYGNISLGGDSDWLTVSMVTDDRSRIKDLGEMGWPEVYHVPVLPAGPEPWKGIRFPKAGESFEESSDGQVTRAVQGHIYVVHTKDSDTDLYAMFRVDALVPNDRCVISWKVVPSPE
jgi:hypothetical protein